MDYRDYTLQELYDALRVVVAFASNDFVLDCTNGITLRNDEGHALAGGSNKTARHLYAERIGAALAAREYDYLELF